MVFLASEMLNGHNGRFGKLDLECPGGKRMSPKDVVGRNWYPMGRSLC